MTLSNTKTQNLWKKGSHTAISCFCPQLAGRGPGKLVIVKWLQTMILYCWNITYHRKLHLISSSRHNPLGSCGQSSSSRLFAPCYHSLPRFPSLARRLSCPTNVGQDYRTSQKKVKAIGSRDDARKVEYYIPLSWSPRVSLRRRVTEGLYVRKVD